MTRNFALERPSDIDYRQVPAVPALGAGFYLFIFIYFFFRSFSFHCSMAVHTEKRYPAPAALAAGAEYLFFLTQLFHRKGSLAPAALAAGAGYFLPFPIQPSSW